MRRAALGIALVSAVAAGGNVIFKTGSTNWTGTVPLKNMTLRAFPGPVTIGQ